MYSQSLNLVQKGIPVADCKTIPELYFFDVLAQTNAIVHLFEKQFGDSVLLHFHR